MAVVVVVAVVVAKHGAERDGGRVEHEGQPGSQQHPARCDACVDILSTKPMTTVSTKPSGSAVGSSVDLTIVPLFQASLG